MNRAQSHVIGIAILLGATMLSLGALTATLGTVVENSAGAADADRVAADVDAALDPVEATGPDRGRVSFAEGDLAVVDRTVRVLNDSGVIEEYEVEGLVFTAGRSRVAFVNGAIVRGEGPGARHSVPPPIAASEEVVIVGVVPLNASGPRAVGGTAATTVTLHTDVTHDRRRLADGTHRVAVETATPAAWERGFAETNATTTRRRFAGDAHGSVVARYPGNRTGYVVVHDVHLEVRHG